MSVQINNIGIFKPYNVEPIYCSLFDVMFYDFNLKNNCYSIEKNIMKFNLNFDGKELSPYNSIKNMIDNSETISYLEIVHYDKFGSKIYSNFLKNFRFVKILNFLDFDWNKSNEIKNLRVIFKYEKIYTITSSSEYEKFNRKIKLEKINYL
jgi:hypothetical protein